MTDDLRTRVEGWLEALGCKPVEQPDAATAWRLGFEYPVGTGHRMLVAGLGGGAPSIVVASVVTLSPEHLERFEGLFDEDKRIFLSGLRRALNRLEVDFRLAGMQGPLSCPGSFQVSVRRFDGGLTLDAFAYSVGAVYKTELDAVWYIQDSLASSEEGPVVHFDFNSSDLPQA